MLYPKYSSLVFIHTLDVHIIYFILKILPLNIIY